MLATLFEAREIDSSHSGLIPANNRRAVLIHVWRPGLLRALAIIISLALHLLVLWLGFFSVPAAEKPQQQVHYIHLNPTAENPSDRYPDPVIEPPLILQEKINVEFIPALKMIDLQVNTRSTLQTLEPLTQQELREITDKFHRSVEGTPAIAGNVFHPGLRAKLSEEANKPKLARVEDAGPKTYIDPSGATIVVLDNGSCLMSPRTTKIGAPQNWYMTSCNGKSESEKMLERVEQSLNQTLKFDK